MWGKRLPKASNPHYPHIFPGCDRPVGHDIDRCITVIAQDFFFVGGGARGEVLGGGYAYAWPKFSDPSKYLQGYHNLFMY